MLKFILMAALCALCIFIGYRFSRKYKDRQHFFEALVMLCQKFDIEMNYSKERIKNIICGLDLKHKHNLFGIDDNYLGCLNQDGMLNKELLFKNISFLKNEEKDVLFLFFKSLGRSDLDSQSKEINNFLSRFNDFTKTATLENKKYGSLSIKLGLVAGLFLIILFI